jgi:hypothetical protein
MGNLPYTRIVKSLDNLSEGQLLDLSAEIENRLAKREMPTGKSSEYSRGWNAAVTAIEDNLDPIFKEINGVNFIAGIIHGEALGGIGNLAIEQMKELSSVLIAWLNRVDISITRAGRVFDLNGVFQTDDIRALFKAAKAYADGSDPKGQHLRRIVENKNDLLYDLMQLRFHFQQGIEPEQVIDRLCTRAKIYRDERFTWEETYDQIEKDLVNPQNRLEQEEYDKLFNNGEVGKIWGVENLKKAYRGRYPAELDIGK